MRYTNEARHKVSSSTCIHLFSFFSMYPFFFLKFRRASCFDFITWREDAGNEQQKGERESETVKDDVKMFWKKTRDTKTSSSEHWNKVDFVSSSYSPSPSSSSSTSSSSLSVQSARAGEKSCNSNDRETIIRRPNELLAWLIPHQFNPKRNRLLVGFIHRTKEREKRKRKREK